MLANITRDPWLGSVVVSRMLMTAIFMTYAACLTVLLEAWDMTATEAGTIAGGFHFGYMISLVVFSWLADKIGASRVFLVSAALSGVTAVLFALFAESFLSGLVLFTLVALSQGGTYYPAIMLISDRYPSERRGGAMAGALQVPRSRWAETVRDTQPVQRASCPTYRHETRRR